jgi:hypothetical protein
MRSPWSRLTAVAALRLAFPASYHVGGVATWRLGLDDPRVGPLFRQWRDNGS